MGGSEPEDPSDFALAVVRSMDAFAEELAETDTDDGPQMDTPMGMPAPGPDQAAQMLRNPVLSYASDNREATMRAMARIHLETGSILEHFAEEDPEELLK